MQIMQPENQQLKLQLEEEVPQVTLNFDDDRKMATVRVIQNLLPIEGADLIELAVVDGWQSVVKKNQFQVGQKVIYCEVDSWIPTEVAPFLTKNGATPRVYNSVSGERLRTMKLRGCLSQGLILPLMILGAHQVIHEDFWEEGTDVSRLLWIQKWEKPMSAQLAGMCRGNFPSAIPKTDQPRIQNITRNLETYNDYFFEVTEKLHGTSCTFYLDTQGVFHVCSRNLDLKETEGNTYWQVARELEIEHKLTSGSYFGVALQGEICGPGINGNQYGLNKPEFFLFDVFQVGSGFLKSEDRLKFANNLSVKHVPLIQTYMKIQDFNSMLSGANFESNINGSVAEGEVWKCIENPDISFKVINNEWLLKNGE